MNDVDRWFGPIASLIVVSAISCIGLYMGQQVHAGMFPWWPYPAFAILVALIFTTYGLLTRDRN